jgi:hypothetical protein
LVPRVKKVVQTLDTKDCSRLLEETRGLASASDILARCEELALRLYPELLN